MSPWFWRSAFGVLLAGIVGTFLYDQLYGYPGEHSAHQLVLAGMAAALVRAQVLLRENPSPGCPAVRRTPPSTAGAPEHLHWPVEVTNVLGEPVGRYICDECYDECPGAQELGEGEDKALLYYRDDDTMWVRDRAGKILQYVPSS